MKRTVEAEWLDALPANDPGALGSRRDLHVLNRLMGHATILRGLMESTESTRPPRRIVELGAGDGVLLLQLAHHFFRRWQRVEVILLDCKRAVSDATLAEYALLGWSAESVVADVLDWMENSDVGMADIMVANLFLHQFETPQLVRLLELVAARTRLFAACEPRRGAFPLVMSQMVGLIGCNGVTQHDAPLSVRAGFTERELSSLWPGRPGWQLQEHSARLFSHAFRAERLG